jgi:hypothetical protein
MPQSRQHLKPNHRTIGRYQRLIFQVKLVAFDCKSQIVMQGASFPQFAIGSAIKKADGVPAVGLGLLHRPIRIGNEVGHVIGITGENRYAHAGFELQHVSSNIKLFADPLKGQSSKRFRSHRLWCFAHDGKLVSAHPCRECVLNRVGKTLCSCTQHRVTNFRSEQIIDLFEVIKPDIDDS